MKVRELLKKEQMEVIKDYEEKLNEMRDELIHMIDNLVYWDDNGDLAPKVTEKLIMATKLIDKADHDLFRMIDEEES